VRYYFYVLISLIICIKVYGAETLLKDEIAFFNVGQGHAALLNKANCTPLLVDAGSNSRPYTIGETHEWTDFQETALLTQISDKILDYWRQSHADNLQGGQYNLNIIITHPDKDHKGFIPLILLKLREAAQTHQFLFFPKALLGGTSSTLHYPLNFLPGCAVEYSHSCTDYSFLNSSNCITHIFCPKGREPKINDTKKDVAKYKNGWSIVARLQINGISVMLTGDADMQVKQQILQGLSGNTHSLLSDILLAPHHGSDEDTYLSDWDQAVNPKAIIIGAAPNRGQGGNRHPRGESIYRLLNFPEGRIWSDRVMPHCILYNCQQNLQDYIQATFFAPRQRLFDIVPNTASPTGEGDKKWHLTWVDVPLYTLWTTGTLIFSENVNTPQFVDAPNGLMTYVAVPNFKYLLPPEQRVQNPTLVSLMDLFLAGGEGEVEQLARMVINLSTEGTVDLAREGLILTDGLSLYQNRSLIIRALLNMQATERSVILDLARPLIRQNKKSFSDRYRILEAVARMQPDTREAFVRFLMDNFLPTTEDDAFSIANTLEVFSHTSLEEAQEIIHFMQPHFPSFLTITQRERTSVLKMIQVLSGVERGRRNTVYQWAQHFIMPRELCMAGNTPQIAFHDVGNNASLIAIFSQVLSDEVEGFSRLLQESWGHLMTDHGPRDLYGENKHYFIRGLLNIASTERLNFLREILPALAQVTEKQFESWVAAAITEELAKIYTEPHFSLRVEYLLRLETQKQNKKDSVFNPESIGFWLKMSVGYAQKHAQHI
jgi:beta-lactamase superfamily II metal-dependent hydrolase